MTNETNRYVDGKRNPVIRGGVMDLRVMLEILKSESLTVITIGVLCVALSILYLHTVKRKYAVRIEITAASSPMQERGGSLGALSSLAGISLGGEGGSRFRVFLGALRSPIAAEAIADNRDLLVQIFPREWYAAGNRWREPPSYVRPFVRGVERLLGWNMVVWSPPGVSRVFDYLNNELKIIPDPKSGVVTLEIDSHRPDVAGRILVTLNNAIDDQMRQHDLGHATTDISYLLRRLSTVTVEEYRQALITDLAEQEKTRMLASAPLPYVSDIMGKPMVSTKPVSPKPVAVLAAGLILGVLLGCGFASAKYYLR